MSEFWLISAPGEKTCAQTWENLVAETSKYPNLCKNHKFSIPDLKVGTLDTLVGLSDDLEKQDTYAESVCHKIAQCIQDNSENKIDDMYEMLKVNNTDMTSYLTKFQWDYARYPTKQSLKSLYDIINKNISQIDADLKVRSQSYNTIKGSLQSLERKQAGSLLVRNLGDLAKKEHFVLGSEYLTTIFVVVPKVLFKDWERKYEKLSEFVVPHSSNLVFEDNDHGLFTVTLFIKFINDFKTRCRENKFIVRDFRYDEEEIAEGKNQLAKLENEKKSKHQNLVRWLKVNFSEAFIAWIHNKVLRLFVESVLRFGLPVNFLAVLILPNKKHERKLRDVLNKLYCHLDTSVATDGPFEDIPGFNMGLQEYYSYVYFKINIDMLSSHN